MSEGLEAGLSAIVLVILCLILAIYYGYLMGKEAGANEARKQLNEQKKNPGQADR